MSRPATSDDLVQRQCERDIYRRVDFFRWHTANQAAAGNDLLPAPVMVVGCSGDCENQRDCTCSHALAWRAPRQPRHRAPIVPRKWQRLARRLWRFLNERSFFE